MYRAYWFSDQNVEGYWGVPDLKIEKFVGFTNLLISNDNLYNISLVDQLECSLSGKTEALDFHSFQG